MSDKARRSPPIESPGRLVLTALGEVLHLPAPLPELGQNPGLLLLAALGEGLPLPYSRSVA